MQNETLKKFDIARGISCALVHNLDVLASRLGSIGMDKLAKEVVLYANEAQRISNLIETATGEAVNSYFTQSVEGTNNMMRAVLAVSGSNPDEFFPKGN